MPEIELAQGRIHYRDQGDGAPILLVHGLLVNGRVWDSVVPQLASRARCIVPDLPLGSHRKAMNPRTDLSPYGLGAMLAEFIERLELDDVTLVGNDTGGALCQVLATEHPEHIARLALIDCDAFEHFPPPAFALVVKLLTRVPGALLLTADLARVPAVRRMGMSMARVTSEPVADELLRSWLTPLRNRGVRRDLLDVLRGIQPEVTRRAAERLSDFAGPALVVWGTRDRFFPVTDGERLAALLPGARLELIEGARTFAQLDAPERVAELILDLHRMSNARVPQEV